MNVPEPITCHLALDREAGGQHVFVSAAEITQAPNRYTYLHLKPQLPEPVRLTVAPGPGRWRKLTDSEARAARAPQNVKKAAP